MHLKKFISIMFTTLLTISSAVFPIYAADESEAQSLSEVETVSADNAENCRLTYRYRVSDVTEIQRYLCYMCDLDDFHKIAYDINRNGIIDIQDATWIQLHCAQFIDIQSEEFLSKFLPEPVTIPTTEPETDPELVPLPEPVTEIIIETPTESEKTATYLTPSECTLHLGINETYQLHYLSDALSLEYISLDTNILSVSDTGLITPHSAGTTSVICTADDCLTAKCVVTVGNIANAVSLNASSIKLGVGELFDLNSYIPANTIAHYRYYSSVDSSIAAVNPGDGMVTAQSIGDTTIVCELTSGAKATCNVKVCAPAPSVSLNVDKLTMGIGETFDVDSYVPGGTASYYRYFYSDNPEVAEIRKSGGIITAKDVGKTTIRCQTGTGAETSFILNVTEKPAKVTLNTYNSPEVVGKDYYLYASTDSGLDKARKFSFVSSDDSIVKITNTTYNKATLTPKNQGEAYITVNTYNGKSAVCKVIVSGSIVKCIDISTWQGGDVDFNKVKSAGVDYVIIRAGYNLSKDNQFENNYRKAKAAGMKVGVYWFSYSTTIYGGVSEANACLKYLNGKQLDLPIYYDLEYEPALQILGYSGYRQMTYNFCNTIKAAGYKTGVYASASDYTSYFSPTDFYSRGYSVWNAHWAKTTPVKCDVWQYSETGRVNGISCNVDLNTIFNLNIAN